MHDLVFFRVINIITTSVSKSLLHPWWKWLPGLLQRFSVPCFLLLSWTHCWNNIFGFFHVFFLFFYLLQIYIVCILSYSIVFCIFLQSYSYFDFTILRKNVLIRSYSGPYFPVFGLNTERYRLSLRIQSECRKLRTRQQTNSEYRHFSRSTMLSFFLSLFYFSSDNALYLSRAILCSISLFSLFSSFSSWYHFWYVIVFVVFFDISIVNNFSIIIVVNSFGLDSFYSETGIKSSTKS